MSNSEHYDGKEGGVKEVENWGKFCKRYSCNPELIKTSHVQRNFMISECVRTVPLNADV
jgi:hypothetical protein